MNCLRRCLLAIVLIGLIGIAVAAGLLFFASRWLPDSDAVAPADAIVVLAGDTRRTLYAADLYRQGLAPQVLISRPIRGVRERILEDMGVPLPSAEEYERMIMLRKGVPATAIDIFGSGSISTYEEGRVLGQRYAGYTPNLLAVTSPYHVRRARMILTNALPGARICVVATPYETFPERWWASQDAARDLLLELTKIAFYAVGGRYLAPAE
jgi:uncharacterized SAM-binding protein YcdF (DUF218 family)